jgi:hypothetical protein
MLDIEAILTTYLQARTGKRIVGTTPSDISTPWVRLTQLDAPPVDPEAERLIAYMVQLDCFAGEHPVSSAGQAEASEIARAVRAALAAAKGTIQGGAAITDVRFVSGPSRIPDTTLEPARERFALTVSVYAHAA